MTAATDTMPALPEPPSHPDNHTMTWTKMELAAIEKYGRQCAEQERERIIALLAGRCARASSLARIMELQDAIEAIRKGTQ